MRQTWSLGPGREGNESQRQDESHAKALDPGPDFGPPLCANLLLLSLPVVAFSAEVGDDVRELCRDARFDGFIARPADKAILRAELDRLVVSAGAGQCAQRPPGRSHPLTVAAALPGPGPVGQPRARQTRGGGTQRRLGPPAAPAPFSGQLAARLGPFSGQLAARLGPHPAALSGALAGYGTPSSSE